VSTWSYPAEGDDVFFSEWLGAVPGDDEIQPVAGCRLGDRDARRRSAGRDRRVPHREPGWFPEQRGGREQTAMGCERSADGGRDHEQRDGETRPRPPSERPEHLRETFFLLPRRVYEKHDARATADDQKTALRRRQLHSGDIVLRLRTPRRAAVSEEFAQPSRTRASPARGCAASGSTSCYGFCSEKRR
jgi:hypothetical protein